MKPPNRPRPHPSRRLPAARAAAWALAAGLLPLLALAARAEVLERVIVKVNGDIVTQSDFEGRQIASVQQAHIGADQIPNYLRENNARILQEAIDDLLLVQRAEELGMRRPEILNRMTGDFIE